MSLHLSDSIPENIIYPAVGENRSLSSMHIKAPALIPRPTRSGLAVYSGLFSIPNEWKLRKTSLC